MAPAKGPLHQRIATGDEPARKSDYAASKRIAAAHDAEQGEAIKAQMRSEGFDPATGRSSSNPATRSSASSSRPFFVPPAVHQFTTGSAGGSAAGAVLAALAFFTGRAFLQGGWTGVRAFYAAKFLNRTSAAPNPVPLSATTKPTLPVNSAPGGSAAPPSPTTSSGSALGSGQTPSGAPAGTGSKIKFGL